MLNKMSARLCCRHRDRRRRLRRRSSLDGGRPATYFKNCDTCGAGFFFIPGTDICLKIGGRVRYDVHYVPTGKYFDKSGVQDVSLRDTYRM